MPQSARDELITLQKRWAKELKRRIYDAQGRNRPDLDKYYDEYRILFQKGFERVATRAELVRQMGLSNVVYFGDYHTLKTAQKTVAMLLEQCIDEHGTRLVLGLEMLHTKHQEHADAYVAGTMDDEAFLKAVDYNYTWGFSWYNYRHFFALARKHKFKIVGLNSHAKSRKGTLVLRDQHAASMVAATSMMYPGHLVAVLFGDLHVGESHLPRRVREILTAKDIERRDLIVYQNSETFYWDLVKQGKDQVVDAVRVKKGVYCIMNATPLVKFQSWLNWQEQGGELEFSGIDSLNHEYRGPTELTHQFLEIVQTIAGFLKIKESGLDGFELYTTGDLDFLDDLVESKVYSRSEIDDLKEVIASQHSAYFPRARTVYLGSLSINDAAEMAARFIRSVCMGRDRRTRYMSPQEDFYRAAFDEALGAFGVMVLNSRFRVAVSRDYREALAKHKSGHKTRGRVVEDPVHCKLMVKHADFVDRVLKTGRVSAPPRSLYTLPAARYRAVTRGIGWELGWLMFQAVNAGETPVDEVRRLFYEKWTEGKPLERYLMLRALYKNLPEKQRPISESL